MTEGFNSVGRVFRRRLRYYREKLGWSQADLADRAGLSVQCIQLAESGNRFPRLARISSIAQALGVAETDLFLPESLTLSPALALTALYEYFYGGKKMITAQSVKRISIKKSIDEMPDNKLVYLEAFLVAMGNPNVGINEIQALLSSK